MFSDIVYLSHVNLNPVHTGGKRQNTGSGVLGHPFDAGASPAADSGFGWPKRHGSRRSKPGRFALDIEQDAAFRLPTRPPRPGACRPIRRPCGQRRSSAPHPGLHEACRGGPPAKYSPAQARDRRARA